MIPMKYLHYHILGFLFLVLLSSCMVEEDSVGSVDGQLVHKVFDATFEDCDMTTKTVLDETVGENGLRGLLWDSGDEIGVARYEGYYQKFTNVLGEPSADGVFEGYIDQVSQYYAIYPYTDNQRHGTSVSVTVPTVQTYRANSFDRNMAPMVGKGNDGEPLHFMNLCGVLAVQLTGSETVKSIVFQTKNGEKVSGICSVDPDYVDYPVLDTSTATETYVTLDCGEGVQLSGEATSFHIVLPPGEYNGFTLVIATADGKFMEKTTSKALTVKRSIVTKAASFDFEDNMTDFIDLSEHGYSNSYIVSEAGLYSFNANIIGIGDFGLIDGAGFHTSDPFISPVSVELLWADSEGLITAYTLDKVAGKVKFMTYANEGNAVIAVKDASGVILWSWHIWVTDQPEEHTYVTNEGKTFVVMDRYLGSTSAVVAENGGALYYQWGRKDPFKFNGSQLDVSFRDPFSNLSESISAPTDYPRGDNWVTGMSTSLWSKTMKTIYDPCPEGWRVPASEIWYGIRKLQDLDSSGYGVVFGFTETDSFWYPDTPRFDNSGNTSGSYTDDNTEVWTSEYGTSYYLYYGGTNANGRARGDAYPIRCMKDENHVDVSTEVIIKRPQISDVGVNSVNVSAGYRYGNSTTVTERGFVYGTTSDLSGADTKTIQVESDGKDYLCLSDTAFLERLHESSDETITVHIHIKTSLQ